MYEYIQGMYEAFKNMFLIPPNTRSPVAKDSNLKFLENEDSLMIIKLLYHMLCSTLLSIVSFLLISYVIYHFLWQLLRFQP